MGSLMSPIKLFFGGTACPAKIISRAFTNFKQNMVEFGNKTVRLANFY